MDTFIEYLAPNSEKWRVELGAALCEDFGIGGDDDLIRSTLTQWHDALAGQGRAWEVACRHYAVFPLYGVTDPEILQPWDDAQISERLGIKPEEVQRWLDGAKVYWKRFITQQQRTAKPSEKVREDAAPLDDTQVQALLLREGFVDVEDATERQYIARRISELGELFENEIQRAMARTLVQHEVDLFYVTEARIREARRELKDALENRKREPGHSIKLEEDRLDSLGARREKQISAIEKTMNALGLSEMQTGSMKRKRQFVESVGGLIEAIQKYYEHDDNALIDGFATLAEVEILTTELDLRPAQYRPDMVLRVPELIENLFNPNYEPPPLARRVVRRLREGFREGLRLARANTGDIVREMGESGDEDSSEADQPLPGRQVPDAPVLPETPASAPQPQQQQTPQPPGRREKPSTGFASW